MGSDQPHGLDTAVERGTRTIEDKSPTSLDADVTGIPSSDEEFRSAIVALQKSTDSIERRTDILTSQRNRLRQLSAAEDDSRTRKSSHVHYFNQRETAEVQHVTFANEQIAEHLRTELQTQRDMVDRDVKAVQATVVEILNSDDRAFAGLNELSASRPKATLDTVAMETHLTKLLTALRHFRVEAVKDRLDRTYLESLGDAPELADASAATIQEIQQDLRCLYSEINDVVAMVASQEHGNAIDASLRHARRARQHKERVDNEQLHTRLTSLQEYLESSSLALEHLQSQRLLLDELSSRYTRLESGKHHSRPKSSTAPPPPPHQLACSALIQHLTLNLPSTLTNSTPTTRHEIDALASNLSRQSAEDMEQIIQISKDAADTGRAALRDISRALEGAQDGTVSAGGVVDVRALEVKVEAVRREMEAVVRPGGGR